MLIGGYGLELDTSSPCHKVEGQDSAIGSSSAPSHSQQCLIFIENFSAQFTTCSLRIDGGFVERLTIFQTPWELTIPSLLQHVLGVYVKFPEIPGFNCM